MDLGVIVIKGYFTLPKLEPHHQMHLRVIPETPPFQMGSYPSAVDLARVFYTLLLMVCILISILMTLSFSQKSKSCFMVDT